MRVIINNFLPPPEQPSRYEMLWWHWHWRFCGVPKPKPRDNMFIIDGDLHVRVDQWAKMSEALTTASTAPATGGREK